MNLKGPLLPLILGLLLAPVPALGEARAPLPAVTESSPANPTGFT